MVLVDLRSDTVTRPTAAMRQAMADAEVGDDDYGEDPTVNRLQEEFAEVTGKEAAVFVPSGIMGNQIALRVLTRPGDGVVCGARQHLAVYEEGAGPINAGITFLTVPDGQGFLDRSDVEQVIEAGRHHQPRVRLIAVEDTHMAAGGRVWPVPRMEQITEVAAGRGISLHLDGARLWNASAASGVRVAERAGGATTVMCCLSKGLGAPVGSLLAGPAAIIDEARLERKRLGGSMRQAGVLAAAGLVALRQGPGRLAEDHARAARIAAAVVERWPDIGFDPRDVETNVVVFSPPEPERMLAHLAEGGVLGQTIGPGRVRLVTHSDVDDEGVGLACRLLVEAP